MKRSDASDLEGSIYRADFEYREFLLQEARRSSIEAHANSTIAATLAATAFSLADFAALSQPGVLVTAAFMVASLGLLSAFLSALISRGSSWKSVRVPRLFRNPEFEQGLAGRAPLHTDVGRSLRLTRAVDGADLDQIVSEAELHWRTRSESAWLQGLKQKEWLGVALWGFSGPVAYALARFATS